jgi:DUF4097 and DUF4098 domain-containing protein YvlB
MNRLFIYAALIAPVFAQEHIPVPLADAARPVTLNVHLLSGSITVRAYNGREILVDSNGPASKEPEKTRDGLRRIGGWANDITIESDNNKVNISSRGGRGGDVTVQTPVNTSLNVKTLNNGKITIEGVNGDIEAQNLNGTVTIRNVSGSVVAHSLNGAVTVSIASAKAGSPMSFSSLNGAIDVTLPPTVAADFTMKTNRGEIYSDFDVKLKAAAKPVVEQSDSTKGKFRVKTDGAVVGAVNGGGPDFKFTTLNGNIYIRKSK